jgi:hypothetical protein
MEGVNMEKVVCGECDIVLEKNDAIWDSKNKIYICFDCADENGVIAYEMNH